MFDIGNVLGRAKEASDLFNRLKGKLLRQSDEAAIKLATVFEEITQIFLFIEAATVTYLCLYLPPARSNEVECRRVLLAMEGGRLDVKADDARGHCHKIETSTRSSSNAGSVNCWTLRRRTTCGFCSTSSATWTTMGTIGAQQ